MVGRETCTQKRYFFPCQVFQQAIFQVFRGLKPTEKKKAACCATAENQADQNQE